MKIRLEQEQAAGQFVIFISSQPEAVCICRQSAGKAGGRKTEIKKERKALNAAYAPVRQRKKIFIEFRSFPDMFSFIVIGHCPECKTGWIVFPLYFMNSDLAPENGW